MAAGEDVGKECLLHTGGGNSINIAITEKCGVLKTWKDLTEAPAILALVISLGMKRVWRSQLHSRAYSTTAHNRAEEMDLGNAPCVHQLIYAGHI